jgi:putative hydrolase of the HAD superfamily
MDKPERGPRLVFGVVFDGDDTLWKTEQLYDNARLRARDVVAGAGLDAVKWEELERRLDVQNVAILGYGTERFPTSCVQAYEELCRSESRMPDPFVAEQIRQAARSVFECNPPIMPDARETLTFLRRWGARLGLLTKGDYEIQCRRIAHSGLSDLFDVIQIVSEKTPETLQEMVTSLGVDVESAWMVGNSVRSDVLPAIAAGLRAVWIDAHVWEHERTHDHLVDDRVITLSSLAEISELLAG